MNEVLTSEVGLLVLGLVLGLVIGVLIALRTGGKPDKDLQK